MKKLLHTVLFTAGVFIYNIFQLSYGIKTVNICNTLNQNSEYEPLSIFTLPTKTLYILNGFFFQHIFPYFLIPLLLNNIVKKNQQQYTFVAGTCALVSLGRIYKPHICASSLSLSICVF